MITIKKDKELFIRVSGMFHELLTRVNIVNVKNGIISFYKAGDQTHLYECHKDHITEIVEPVSSVEMFQMWVNWNNFKDDHIRRCIVETLKRRSYVMYGSGKFEPYDYSKYEEIMFDESPFKFKVGETYDLQDGTVIKVIGRTDTKAYETLICSDGIYRYDRSTDSSDSPDKGRACASNIELMDPKNIFNRIYDNRYIFAINFSKETGRDLSYVIEGQNILNDKKMRKEYKIFLKDRYDKNLILDI